MCASVFDLAAQSVVVAGIHLFSRSGADVALFRPCVLFVDALFDLREQLQELLTALLLRLCLCVLRAHLRIFGGQGSKLLFDGGEHEHLLLLQGIELALHVFIGITHAGQ